MTAGSDPRTPLGRARWLPSLPGNHRWRVRALVTVILISAATVGAFHAAPSPARLGASVTGDTELAARVRAAAGPPEGYRGLSVVVVERNSSAYVGIGDSGDPDRRRVDASTVFEAGSLGKPMTGMLLAALEDRKALSLDTPVEQLLPDSRFSDPAVGAATLEDLAGHRAGLEKMPTSLSTMGRDLRLRLFGQDPYRGLTEGDVLRAAETASAARPGTYQYSNLGMALAGHAAARRTGRPYEQLLSAYVLAPLGMRDTRIMHRGSLFPPRVAKGQQATGPPTDHWFASGYSPAGDVWTTGRDMGRFLKAVIRGTAPGARAAVPAHNAGPGQRTGLGWLTTRIDGRDITWHNGATGGFTSYMGFDRATGRGVAVLSNTSRPADGIGERLLGLRASGSASDTGQLVAAVLGSLGAAVPALAVMLRTVLPIARRSVLLGLHGWCGGAALWVTYRLGDWTVLPTLIWTVGAANLTACVLIGIGHMRRRTVAERTGQVSRFVTTMCRTVLGWTAGLTVLLVNVM